MFRGDIKGTTQAYANDRQEDLSQLRAGIIEKTNQELEMVRITLIFLVGLTFTACSQETYTYAGKEYRVYSCISQRTEDIRALDLSDNNHEIDEQVYKLKSLEYLNLSNKGLLSVDARVCGLTSLKVLLLNNNEGVDLPPCLFEMNTLKVLSLVDCRYNALPARLYKMTNLETLAIMGNSFSEEELERLEKLLPNTKVIAYLD